MRIGSLFGQRSQLWSQLTPRQSYALLARIYRLDARSAATHLAELADLLDAAALLDRSTRTLSLGERMRCELLASVLHRPEVLFLDEPTIGLDVAMQLAIRDFIRSYNQRHEATVLLTSHYMDDVVALCPRIIVIDEGKLVHDGDLRALIKTMDPDKRVSFTTSATVDDAELAKLGTVHAKDGPRVTLRVAEREIPAVIGHLLGAMKATDLAIEDPPLEDILRQMFGKKHT
jgi:ABC-2 type transport system ATP-binding protein